MKLAHHIVPSEQKYCFMMDDSVRLWRGVTLVSDPYPRWTNNPSSEKSKSEPVSMRQVLEFFQKNENAMAQLRAPIYEDKVVDHLLDTVEIEEEKVSREELLSEDEE